MKDTLTADWMYSPRAQMMNQGIAMALTIVFIAALVNVGLQLAVIVGGSAIIGFFCWRITNLRRAIDPVKTAIVFLLTTAALHVHMYEEQVYLFGPAMSRLFGMALSEPRFLQIFVFILPTVYYLTAIGLLLRIPLAAFVAWFIFIGPGIAEFTHFVFPLIQPALEPANPSAVTAVINGVSIAGMENHHIAVAGKYYFPGMYTAVLPMIPGIYSVWWLLKNRSEAAIPVVGAEALATRPPSPL
jgi:hypothetical protein